jgi:predicted phosphodiesterase
VSLNTALERWFPTFRRGARYLLPVVVGVVGAWLGMALWGAREVPMGPFQVRLEGGFGRGVTEIHTPPFGRLSADTHVSPIRLTATLLDVRVPELSSTITEEGTAGLVAEVERDALSRLRPFAARLALVAALGALLGGLAMYRTRWREVLASAVTGLVVVGGAQGLALVTYSPAAFTQPRFSGSLALAPKLIGPVREATDRIDDFRVELERIVTGAVRAYTSIRLAGVGGEATIRVLHISDVHLSPLGQEFAAQVARGFEVQAVIDTGDLTSFGTRPESFVLGSIRELGLPYVFVRGNHDSRALEAQMASLGNVTVLDGDSVEIAGLTIYGLGHPEFTPNKEAAVTDREFAESARAQGGRIVADVEALPRPPDVIAVHDDRMAEAAAGLVPLVVSGHFHETTATARHGTLFLRVGSTGGSGFTIFTEEGGIPLTVQVLYFEPGPEPQLVAWDVITQSPETGSFTVDRHVVELELGELEPTPPAEEDQEEPTPTPEPTGAEQPIG